MCKKERRIKYWKGLVSKKALETGQPTIESSKRTTDKDIELIKSILERNHSYIESIDESNEYDIYME